MQAEKIEHDALQAQAAAWAARRRQGLDDAGEAALRAWLEADGRHAAALAQMEAMAGRLRVMPADQVAALKEGLRKPRLEQARASASAWQARRGWMPQFAVAALVLVVTGGGWAGWDYWQNQPLFEQTYATAGGQRRTLELADGSRLELDRASRAEVRLYRQRREVRLAEGQAMFAVKPDPARPFQVLAGATRVTVVGTRFSVRHTAAGIGAGGARVEVEQGRVRVEPALCAAGAACAPVLLTAGQAVAADRDGGLAAQTTLAPGSVAAWRQDRVNFDDTPLAQALAEFERYGATGLVLGDPALGALRIGGSFSLQRTDSFARALPQLLPVRLVRRNGATEIVRAR